jgi:GxxExxY protein
MSKNVLHFNKNSNNKIEKFVNCPDYSISEEALELYRKVKEKAEEVFNILGDSYREEIYTGALGHELKLLGYIVETEVECDVMYKNSSLGKMRADLVASGFGERFVVESKRSDPYKGLIQLLGYMTQLHIPLGFTVAFQKEQVRLWMVLHHSFIFDGTHVKILPTPYNTHHTPLENSIPPT